MQSTTQHIIDIAPEAKTWYHTWSAKAMRARSEVGLSRLPVTEKIAGSNPVGPATKTVHQKVDFFRGKMTAQTEVF